MFKGQGQRSKLRFGIKSETVVGKPLNVKLKLVIPVIRPLLKSRPKFETVNKTPFFITYQNLTGRVW